MTATCRAITPPSTDACGKPSVALVTFSDSTTVRTCEGCALNLRELARSHGTSVKVEKLT